MRTFAQFLAALALGFLLCMTAAVLCARFEQPVWAEFLSHCAFALALLVAVFTVGVVTVCAVLEWRRRAQDAQRVSW